VRRSVCSLLKKIVFASRINVRKLTVLGLLSCPLGAFAQFETIRFDHLTINDGLSQSSINSLLEDRRGFLWVGTQDGLNRFDGYEFVVYRHDGDDPSSLGSNNVSSLYEDSAGALWIGTTSGYIHRYDRARDSFERFQLPPQGLGGPDTEFPDDLKQIVEASDGRLWIGTRARGLWLFDRNSGTFENVESVPDVRINSLFEGPDGMLWVGTDELGLIWYSPATKQLSDPEVAGSDRIYSIIATGSGEIWVAGNDGMVSRYRPNRSLIVTFSARLPTGFQNYQVRAMLDDGDGHIWMGLIGGGVQVYSPEGERLEAFSHLTGDPYSLSTDTAFSLLLDSAGVLWVGSLANGLSKASLSGARFQNYWFQPGDPFGLSHNMVVELAEGPEGEIWVGTSGGGLNRFDRVSGRFTQYRAAENDENSLSSDRIWGLHLDGNGIVWVGTWGEGLNRLDTRTEKITRIPVDPGRPNALPGSIVTTIVEDGADGIWIGTADGGLLRKAAANENFERHYLFDEGIERRRPVNISTAYFDSKERLWVGTWTQGLCVRIRDTGEFHCYAYREGDDTTINDNNIRAINEDSSGNIWIATAVGIARYVEEDDLFVQYSSAEGLPHGTIYGILPEGDHVLWLSSNQGLARLDILTANVRIYDYKDGLQANEFNGDAALKSNDGTFFFGGIGGITSFKPGDLGDNPIAPKIVITAMRLFNKSVPIEPDNPNALMQQTLDETDSITLSHTQNVFSLTFAGLHFVSPELNSYAHKLEGFDRDWVYTDASRRDATYTNLDPGEYKFRVRAANSDGLWSQSDAVLRITVLPPWWDTLIARTAIAIALLLSTLLLYRWRVSLLQEQKLKLESEVQLRTQQMVDQKDTIEKQAQHLEEVLEAKNQFFARLSHEFRTPITLMLGPIEEQLEHSPSGADKRALTMARRNGRRLLHLVNQLLGLARQSGEQSIELSPVNVSPIARMLGDSFLPLLVNKKQEFEQDIDENVWVRGNAEGLQIVLSNLVSNAIKYTDGKGHIKLSVKKNGGDALIQVSDNGVGIPSGDIGTIFNLFERGTATGPGSGIGLTLVNELVNAHEGHIEVTSVVGKGTTFEVRMPALVTEEALSDPAAILGQQDLELFVDYEDVTSEGPEAIDEPMGKPQVLVVEDNTDMRHYIVDLLREEYHCLEARDGKVGIEAAVRELPDLVISDIMMPETDGFELLSELRDNDHTSHIPVILLTALDDQESRLRGLSGRADDYLSKPFDRRELILRVRNLLELTRIRARRMGQVIYASDAATSSAIGIRDGLGRRDKEFLAKLEQIVSENYHDAGFRLEQLADGVYMSPRQLQRKLKALLDTAPAAYLRDYRLKLARQQLSDGRAVTDVAFATGFSSVSYFGKCFKSRFGTMPSEIQSD